MRQPALRSTERRVRDRGQRGSALLIVFVMAAAIAIMLYLEMPVASFEARRQKEQLLIDRGNEYAHGVKLYLRKVGHYPPSMDALENTNRMRFLRHRFKDPFTGEDNWRLLHAGPGGMLIDSKVNPLKANGPNQTGVAGSPTVSGSSGSQTGGSNASTASVFAGFNNNIAPASSTGSDVVVPVAHQRAPAMAANGGQPAGATDGAANPMTPMIQASPDPATTGASVPSGLIGQSGQPGQNMPGQGAPGQNNQLSGGTGNNLFATGQAGSTAGFAQTGGTGSSIFQNSPAGSQGTGSTTGPGQLNSGGLAGVASIAKGHTIKTVNDQTDYSLWEFFYDPSKDTMRIPGGSFGGAAAIPGQGLAGQNGSANGVGLGSVSGQQSNTPSGFNFGGPSGSSTGTGGGGSFSTPFGSTTTPPVPTGSNPSIGTPTSSPQQPQ